MIFFLQYQTFVTCVVGLTEYCRTCNEKNEKKTINFNVSADGSVPTKRFLLKENSNIKQQKIATFLLH